MVNEFTENEPRADLQTAQNRMFSFVSDALKRYKEEEYISALIEDPDKLADQFIRVQQQLFGLLNIDVEKRKSWHMGIADSGKRTIELLVNFLCPAHSGRNAIVDTENYVGFNKFSAAKALEKQKGVSFETPFKIELGRALTINAEKEFNKLTQMFKDDRFDNLWLSWNSTSTGVREEITEIVKCRNATQSKTRIIADAASYRLFSNEWKNTSEEHLPDVFFFSLRKQGLPYDGPNDELNQAQNSGSLIVFNDKALELADQVNADTIYDSPTLSQYAGGRITRGAQQTNHVQHLLKLNCALDYFLSRDMKSLIALDDNRKTVHAKIQGAFALKGGPSASQFSLFSDPDAQSESAYILKVPESTSAKKVISGLKERGIFISACMHPKMDSKKYVRFAFYPGNRPDEIDYFLEQIKEMA